MQEGASKSDAEDVVDTVDRERIAFVKHYFGADWPTRSLYHVMINTAVGDESVVDTILHTMRLDEDHPKATGYEPAKVHSSN
jgi:Cytidylate kinase-like family